MDKNFVLRQIEFIEAIIYQTGPNELFYKQLAVLEALAKIRAEVSKG